MIGVPVRIKCTNHCTLAHSVFRILMLQILQCRSKGTEFRCAIGSALGQQIVPRTKFTNKGRTNCCLCHSERRRTVYIQLHVTKLQLHDFRSFYLFDRVFAGEPLWLHGLFFQEKQVVRVPPDEKQDYERAYFFVRASLLHLYLVYHLNH